jgi:hypothetical protein
MVTIIKIESKDRNDPYYTKGEVGRYDEENKMLWLWGNKRDFWCKLDKKEDLRDTLRKWWKEDTFNLIFEKELMQNEVDL